METILKIFGSGKELEIHQMLCRGILIFFFALILIRISGRRSFGVRTPLDNIILILLGAILSRAVVGASPFMATIVTSAGFVLLHRFLAFFIARSERFARLVEGKKILLFDRGQFLRDNMRKALVCEEDVLQGVRKSALTEDMNQIDRIYIERNGTISAIKK